MACNLWVVMPVLNEQESIEAVVREWTSQLRTTCPGFVLCVVNDGSTDNTPDILQKLGQEFRELVVVNRANFGHGQTCVFGYRYALSKGAEWVFQIDSDGQCDPQFFPDMWANRGEENVVFGYRKVRNDGIMRFLISRLVSIAGWVAFGVWVRDANVPYRLMARDAIRQVVDQIPADFHLANVLLALLLCGRYEIRWHDIVFRKRLRGQPSVKPTAIVRVGWQLYSQLRYVRKRLRK